MPHRKSLGRPAAASGRWTLAVLLLPLIALALFAEPALAAYQPPPLAERLTPEVMAAVWPVNEGRPAPTGLGPEEGTPPSIAVYVGEEVAGYLFSTHDVVAAPGYSGTVFDVIAGVDTAGKITGAMVIYHHEAYIERDPARQAEIAEFLARLEGMERDTPHQLRPDFVKSATVSARAMRAAVYDAARLVGRARSGRPPVTEPTLDREGFVPLTVEQLYAEGALVTARITNGEVEAWAAGEGEGFKLDENLGKDPDGIYSEVSVALGTPARIGRNVLGVDRYKRIFETGQNMPVKLGLIVTSRGEYDFLGINFMKRSKGFFMDRIRVIQGENTFTFTKDNFERATGSTIHIPNAIYAGIVSFPEGSGFDPLQPFRFELLINGTRADGTVASLPVAMEYRLPEAAMLLPEPPPAPAWLEAWQEARLDLIVLGAALGVLTLLLAFQQRLTRNRTVHRWVRFGFLAFVLVWLGWIAGAQLSTLHVMNYVLAPFRNYDIGFYLAEPLILVLATYALIGLIVLGRGVFCGWLCPFGAMQELLANLARFLRLPQWNPSERVQRKAWLVKYVAAAAVVVVAFTWPEMESTAAEVEPFKTAITSMFTRPWPFIVYAVLLLVIGLFTERFYCRFLCPLGGILALLDRLHLVNLLKRRPECGSPCHLCERSCPVKAIENSGKIKMAECFQCLDCQVEYQDDRRCPPLAKARKQAARLGPAIGQPVLTPVGVAAMGRAS